MARMNDQQPIKWQPETQATHRSSAGARHRTLIGFLAALIVLVMLAWFGFLGWGMLELFRSLLGFGK
jgi:type VI protein secretion system component VasF